MSRLKPDDIAGMLEIFKDLGPDAITLSHYDLAEQTEIRDPEQWKQFLMEPEVKRWIESEVTIMQDTELKRLVKGAAKSKSMGQAQLINAFSKLNEKTNSKEGPIIIYSFVPLNENQKAASNINILDKNIFKENEI